METRIGIIPLPVFVVLVGIVTFYTFAGKLPTECSMMMAVMALFGFACGEGRQAPAGAAAPGRRRDFCHLHSVLPGLPPLASAGGDQDGDGLHEIHGLPLPVHRRDHRRQHLGYGPAHAHPGVFQDRDSHRSRNDPGRADRDPGGRGPGFGRQACVFLRRHSDHGRGSGRGGDSALDRLCGHPAPGAGRKCSPMSCRR